MATAELSGGLRSQNANQRHDTDRPHLDGPGWGQEEGGGAGWVPECRSLVLRTCKRLREISESLSENYS